MLDSDVPEADSAAFLAAMARKGETSDELDGAVRAIRDRMTRFGPNAGMGTLLDTCGTGGDCSNTINISTAAAVIVAACGTPVVKHGNKAASSPSGSSDVLMALGVAIDPGAAILDRCLVELRIAFLFAPRFHPGLARVAPIRRQLPFRTVFNLVGPLCNPARPSYQLIGVAGEDRAELVAQVLSRDEQIRRAVVVSGSDGLDEVTLEGPTSIRVIERGHVTRGVWHPEDFGLANRPVAAIKIAGPMESAARIRATFAGGDEPVRDYLLANSAAALWATGRHSLGEAMRMASHAIDSGAAAQLLARWAALAPASAS
jgi:anthranilate phosphoribosyltransferase